jgi:hypothetical protein
MALNISIDVDGTLLDENEILIPQVREKLLPLKPKGHRLQLWSTAGAEYAYKVAVKHNLTDLFDSYGTKPDVAIDDIPESARPVAILKVDKTFRLTDAIDTLTSKLENCVEAAIRPSPNLVSHVAAIQTAFADIPQPTKDVLGMKPLPIPFFGNVEHARLVTVGLNPSSGEFAPWREWEAVSGPEELTFRLVNYFRLAGVVLPPAHRWFGEILEASRILRCPHAIATAHVDFCPWATGAPNGGGFWHIFWDFIDQQMNLWLSTTFQRCRNARLVVIVQTDNPGELEQNRQLLAEDIIRTALGPEWHGQIEIQSKAQLPAWTWQNRVTLRNLIDFHNVIA